MYKQQGIGHQVGKSKGAAKRRRAAASKSCTPYTRAWPSGKGRLGKAPRMQGSKPKRNQESKPKGKQEKEKRKKEKSSSILRKNKPTAAAAAAEPEAEENVEV